MKHESDSSYLNGSRSQQNWSRIQQDYIQETQLIHWKPSQLRFCINIVFLSPDELTVVK